MSSKIVIFSEKGCLLCAQKSIDEETSIKKCQRVFCYYLHFLFFRPYYLKVHKSMTIIVVNIQPALILRRIQPTFFSTEYANEEHLLV